MRYALSGTNAFSPLIDFVVLLGFGIIILGIGVYQFSKVEL